MRPGWKWLILSTVLFGATVSALDVSIVTVAMPTLKSVFHVSMAEIEWVAIAYMLTLVIFLPLFGKLSDIFGRSRLYSLGFIIFSAGSLFCGLSRTAGFLISARVIQALGAGLLQANSVAIITHAFPAGERGKAIGIQGAVQAVSMAIAPFIGGVLISTINWQSIFYLNIPIGLVGTAAAVIVLPPDRERRKEKVDYPGAALFAAGLGSLLLALNEAVRLGWASHTILAYLGAAALLLVLFTVRETRVEHPLIDLRLFKSATFLLGNVNGMLSYYVLFALLFVMPFYLQRVLGYSVTVTGLLLTPLLLAMAASAPLSGRISDRHGSRGMTTLGMMVSALACLWLLSMGEAAHSRGLVGALICLGLGMGLFIPSNNNAIMGSAPRAKLAMAGGLLNMTRSLGLIFGVNISAMVLTGLEHNYLAERGFPNAQHIFSNSSIPMPLKADAFMHGFMVVIVVLMGITVLGALLASLRKARPAGLIEREAAGAVVLSSGFMSGFSQETAGLGLLVMGALFAGYLTIFAGGRLRSEGNFFTVQTGTVQTGTVQTGTVAGAVANDPEALGALALQYYASRYKDRDVSVQVLPAGDHVEADIRKNGLLVKRLSIRGDHITEHRPGVRGWVLDQFMFAN